MLVSAWNLKHPSISGCFNWMIPTNSLHRIMVGNHMKSPNIHFKMVGCRVPVSGRLVFFSFRGSTEFNHENRGIIRTTVEFGDLTLAKRLVGWLVGFGVGGETWKPRLKKQIMSLFCGKFEIEIWAFNSISNEVPLVSITNWPLQVSTLQFKGLFFSFKLKHLRFLCCRKSRASKVNNILESWMKLHGNCKMLGPKSPFVGVEDGTVPLH